jgi:hypothetical protein
MQHVRKSATSQPLLPERDCPGSYDRTQALIAVIEARYHARLASLIGSWAMQLQIALEQMPQMPEKSSVILQSIQYAMSAIAKSELPGPSEWEPDEVRGVEFEGLQSWTIEPPNSMAELAQ